MYQTQKVSFRGIRELSHSLDRLVALSGSLHQAPATGVSLDKAPGTLCGLLLCSPHIHRKDATDALTEFDQADDPYF
jgi:hypothetical protein